MVTPTGLEPVLPP